MAAKCRKGKPCKGLDEHYLNNEANARQKGLSLFVTTNLKTWVRTVAGVMYRKDGNRPGVLINHCPSCGESLDAWREDVTVQEKAAAPA